MIKEGLYLWNGKIVRLYDIAPNSFSYTYPNHDRKIWGTYGQALSSNSSPFQYEKFMTPVDDLTELEKIIYGI